ncbi:hypothetical protein HDU76_010423 [Blyttiomyces sp. JEL0837]|nr:hypothetical protein HDU76_010423 [Blyttiomyces sp. JEL0837]
MVTGPNPIVGCPTCHKLDPARLEPDQTRCNHEWHTWFELQRKAATHFQQKDFRKAADILLQLYNESDPTTFQPRYHCLSVYNRLLTWDNIRTDQDITILKENETKTQLPMVYRIENACTQGNILCCESDYDAAVHRFLRALDLLVEGESDETNMNSWLIGPPTFKIDENICPSEETDSNDLTNLVSFMTRLTVKQALQQLRFQIMGSIAELQRPLKFAEIPFIKPHVDVLQELVQACDDSEWKRYYRQMLDRDISLLLECSCCKNTVVTVLLGATGRKPVRDQDGYIRMVATNQNRMKLKRCSKCKKVAYCSTECQKNDWIAHKKVCRAFDEFHQGDIVKIRGAADPGGDLNGSIGEIVGVEVTEEGGDPVRDGKFLVVRYGWFEDIARVDVGKEDLYLLVGRELLWREPTLNQEKP